MDQEEWLGQNYPKMVVGYTEEVKCAVCGKMTRTPPQQVRQFYTCSSECDDLLQENYNSGILKRWEPQSLRQYEPNNELRTAREYRTKGEKMLEKDMLFYALQWFKLAAHSYTKIIYDCNVDFNLDQWRSAKTEFESLENRIEELTKREKTHAD